MTSQSLELVVLRVFVLVILMTVIWFSGLEYGRQQTVSQGLDKELVVDNRVLECVAYITYGE